MGVVDASKGYVHSPAPFSRSVRLRYRHALTDNQYEEGHVMTCPYLAEL